MKQVFQWNCQSSDLNLTDSLLQLCVNEFLQTPMNQSHVVKSSGLNERGASHRIQSPQAIAERVFSGH